MPRTLTAAVMIAALAVPASAQIKWDSPPLISPVVPAGLSVFVLSPSSGDLGALATFRRTAGPVGIGYRAALAEEPGTGDVAFGGGVDISGFLSRAVEGSEIDVIWWSGAGVGFGREQLLTAPVGIILGWSGSGTDVILSPYAGGHLTLDISTDDANTVRFDGSVDLGLDVVLASGWMVRFGATIGDRDALALGIKVPGGGG